MSGFSWYVPVLQLSGIFHLKPEFFYTMVLCLTHSGDYYTIDIVQQRLQGAGMPVYRFNSDEFGVRYRFGYATTKGVPELYIETEQERIAASQIKGVWYRKLWELQCPSELDATWHDVYHQEYQAYRQLFFNALSHVPWMNNLHRDHYVNSDKLYQLSVAQSVGLMVPDTVFTNDAAIVRAFAKKHAHNVVMKLHGALSKSMSGNTPFFPTTRLHAKDEEQLESLRYCPMIFQEFIPKAYELRIAWVDGACFAGKIPGKGVHEVDWRITPGGPIPWERYELPHGIKAKLHRLMQELGLLFGAIDMVRHPNGDYIFLEVNPQGEWGMIQKHLGYPIGETIADKLLARIQSTT